MVNFFTSFKSFYSWKNGSKPLLNFNRCIILNTGQKTFHKYARDYIRCGIKFTLEKILECVITLTILEYKEYYGIVIKSVHKVIAKQYSLVMKQNILNKKIHVKNYDNMIKCRV